MIGYPEVKALKKATSESLYKFIIIDIISRYGLPKEVVVNNGSENKGELKVLLSRLRIKRITISAYNKRANGIVEVRYKSF